MNKVHIRRPGEVFTKLSTFCRRHGDSVSFGAYEYKQRTGKLDESAVCQHCIRFAEDRLVKYQNSEYYRKCFKTF